MCKITGSWISTAAVLASLAGAVLAGAERPRARDLGVRFRGAPGPLNAITDIAGVTVGHVTLIEGDAVRTGVTVLWPRGLDNSAPVFGGWYSLNGNGEMTGTAWIDESGFIDGPVAFTNTHSVGVVRDAIIQWQVRRSRKPATTSYGDAFWSLPVVAETYDGFLNDVNGFHVKPEHLWRALESARGGPVAEGNVGGGTGMVCYGFKGGIGTASRKAGPYMVGALVQCNCGRRQQLTIAGVPVGQEIQDAVPYAAGQPGISIERGSILIAVATDAPLLPHQLKRRASRAAMGLARTGSTSMNGSGDLFLALSTAATGAPDSTDPQSVRMLPNEAMNPLFEATVESVEEAIVNSMVAADTLTGIQNHTVVALPHERLREAMRKWGRNP